MLLIVEKGIRGGTFTLCINMEKANNKFMKESSYIQYWDVNNLYGWAMSQKLSVEHFEWIKDTSQVKLMKIS